MQVLTRIMKERLRLSDNIRAPSVHNLLLSGLLPACLQLSQAHGPAVAGLFLAGSGPHSSPNGRLTRTRCRYAQFDLRPEPPCPHMSLINCMRARTRPTGVDEETWKLGQTGTILAKCAADSAPGGRTSVRRIQ